MATDAKKMIRLVQERTAYGVPKDAPGVCTMQDEDGNPRIKLGFDAHRDYITVMGYGECGHLRGIGCALRVGGKQSGYDSAQSDRGGPGRGAER